MSMLYNSGSDDAPYRELKFERAVEGEVNFLVDRKSGFNHSSTFETLNRYFTEEFLTKYAFDVSYKGGRGTTMLFALPYENAVLMYGPKKDPTLVNQHAVVHSNPNEIPSNLKASHGSRSGASLKSASLPSAAAAPSENTVVKSISHPQRVSTLGTDNNDTAATPSYYILCLRPYMRGGLIGKIMKDKYLRYSETAFRARNEFCLLQRLYKMGLPVPRPLIAREQVGFMFVKNAILIEQIPNTSNLAELMVNDELNIDHLLAVGTTLKRFFTREVVHTDLNIRNILIDNNNKCFIIDFDKCYIKGDFSEADCDRMLSRLERSFKKELNSLLSEEKDAQKLNKIAKSLIDPIRNAALGIEVEDPSELLLPSLSKKDAGDADTQEDPITALDGSNPSQSSASNTASYDNKAASKDAGAASKTDSSDANASDANASAFANASAADDLALASKDVYSKDSASSQSVESSVDKAGHDSADATSIEAKSEVEANTSSTQAQAASMNDKAQEEVKASAEDKNEHENLHVQSSDESKIVESSDDSYDGAASSETKVEKAQENAPVASLKKVVLPKAFEKTPEDTAPGESAVEDKVSEKEVDSSHKEELVDSNSDVSKMKDSPYSAGSADSSENETYLDDALGAEKRRNNRKGGKLPRGLRKNKKS